MHRTLGEREVLFCFFMPPPPFPRSGKSYFTLTLLFATSLLNLRAWNKPREILRNWSTMTKHLDLPKNFKTLFFVFFFFPQFFLVWTLLLFCHDECPCVIILSFLNTTSPVICIFGQILIKCCVSSSVKKCIYIYIYIILFLACGGLVREVKCKFIICSE